MRIGVGMFLGLAVLALAIVLITRASEHQEGRKAGRGDYPAGVAIPPQRLGLTAAAEGAHCRLLATRNEGRHHTTSKVHYGTNPPTSGDHAPTPAQDGAYAESPPSESTVHALEHGRVFIQFRPNAPPRLRGQLFAVFEEDRSHMLLGPNVTGMPWEVAATAWRHALLCPRMNDRVFDALRLFRDRYRNRGPELVK